MGGWDSTVTGLPLGEPAGRVSIAGKVKRYLSKRTGRSWGASRVPGALSLE